MIINYQIIGRCIWHSDCVNHFGGIMIVRENDKENKQTLMECLHCGKRGYYPHGKAGPVMVKELTPSAVFKIKQQPFFGKK